MFGNINKINNIRGMYVFENNFYTCNFIYGGGVQIMTEIQRGKNGIVGIQNGLKEGEEVRKEGMRIRRKREPPFHLYYLIQILYEKYNLINI